MRDDASRALFERASRGDAKAVDALLQRHLPGLDAYVRKRLGGVVKAKESASDLVQSACREVLEHADRYRYDGEEGFRRWLYATALRKLKDRHRYYRAERRDAAREVHATASASAPPGARLEGFFRSLCTPSQAAAAREELVRAERAFAELPEKYRQVIVLAHVEALPYAEVGARMGITEAYVSVLLPRALAKLAKELARKP